MGMDVMAKNIAIRELDGTTLIHYPGPGGNDYVLCGLTMDGDSAVVGSEPIVVRRAVTCDQCLEMVRHCRTLRLPRKK